jgi:hypothetical protein
MDCSEPSREGYRFPRDLYAHAADLRDRAVQRMVPETFRIKSCKGDSADKQAQYPPPLVVRARYNLLVVLIVPGGARGSRRAPSLPAAHVVRPLGNLAAIHS